MPDTTTVTPHPAPPSIGPDGRPRLGAWMDGDRVRFRVWAPDRRRVEVVLYRRDGSAELGILPMERSPDGYFTASFPAALRLHYKYRVDGEGPFPDPASRAQPLGVHGPSEVADDRFGWTDADFSGLALEDLVLYEVHVGTATRPGTFDALIPTLPSLRELGVTAIELMPVAAFPGRRNWGYDGVSLYAPHAGYGGPFALKRLVDAAHALGLGVILDVVYNHLGPDGNYLRAYGRSYFTDRHMTPWGDAVDFGNPDVRAFFFQNAAMWVRDFHIDGLRLDATHAIPDDTDPPFLGELGACARAAGGKRHVLVIAEDDRNDRRLLLPRERGGCGLDAVWADDFHHSLRRALAGDHDGYFADYTGRADELATIVHKGWLYHGQHSTFRGGPRGTPSTGLSLSRFVHCIQNHDQIGNRAQGDRLGAAISPAAFRAASALLLLSPSPPLIFMGQEWNARTPFLYFTDHQEPLGTAVREGRRAEFAAFTAFGGQVPDPQAFETYERSILDEEERARPPHAAVRALYRELLRLRAHHPALRGPAREQVAAWPIGDRALGLRRRRGDRELVLLVNLRGPLRTDTGPARLLLHTEEERFGGDPGSVSFDAEPGVLSIEGPGAVVLEPHHESRKAGEPPGASL